MKNIKKYQNLKYNQLKKVVINKKILMMKNKMINKVQKIQIKSWIITKKI